MMGFLFDILYAVVFLLYLPFLFFRRKWHAGFLERFGFLSPPLALRLSQGQNIWLHAVSVGEVAAMAGVIEALKGQHPHHRLVLTVTTKAGHLFAMRKYQSAAEVVWSPLDFSLTVDHFVRVIRPVIYIAAETELWPNLFARLASDRIPVVVLNGRISDQSFPRYNMVKRLLPKMLGQVRSFAMQSQEDARRIIALGAPPTRVQVMGNVKYDNIPDVSNVNQVDFGCAQDVSFLVAGSTHPGEEDVLLRIFKSMTAEYPHLRLALAPRHPERAAQIASLVLNQGFKPVLLSQVAGVLRQNEVLIVDTIGHLLQLYSLASVVFVGKSLKVGGGHNIIEPAVFAKPVIVGPMMQNFKDITGEFLRCNALIQVAGEDDLKAAVLKCLSDPDFASQLGARAKSVVMSNQGATQRAMALINNAMRP